MPQHKKTYDHIMPRVSESAWKVICLIIRHTKGEGESEIGLGYSAIMEGTGIKSRATVSRALQELLKGKYIKKKEAGGRFEALQYHLNEAYFIEVDTGLESELSSKNEPDDTGSKNEPDQVQFLNCSKDTRTSRQTCRNVDERARANPTAQPSAASSSSSEKPLHVSTEAEAALLKVCRVNPAHPSRSQRQAWPAVRAMLASWNQGRGASPADVQLFDEGRKMIWRDAPELSQVLTHWERFVEKAQQAKNQTPSEVSKNGTYPNSRTAAHEPKRGGTDEPRRYESPTERAAAGRRKIDALYAQHFGIDVGNSQVVEDSD